MNTNDNGNNLILFTDGSSLGNPGPGGWGVVLIYQKLDEIIELGGSQPITTNNEMELTAILSALSYAVNSSVHIHLYTDSKYAIGGLINWMYTWAKNGWNTAKKEPIKNKDIWKQLYSLVTTRGKDTISYHHLRGHTGIPGNERVDTIARELAKGINVSLYRGSLSQYPHPNILDVSGIKYKEALKKKNAKAYCYLSLVDGVLNRHETWAECEKHTTGYRSKFKKALSPEHEKEILDDWGITDQ